MVFDIPDCGTIALGTLKEALPEGVLPSAAPTTESTGQTAGSESSILTTSSTGESQDSPRGVVESSVAFSEEMLANDDKESGDFAWTRQFETLATDIQAVQSDIVHFGTELTTEVLAQTKLATQSDRKR